MINNNKRLKSEQFTIVFLFFTFSFFLFFTQSTLAATLYLFPQSQTVYRGDSFLVEVRLDNENQEINAAEVFINFPADKIEVKSVNQGGSDFSLWPKAPSFSNDKAEISFVGGAPGGIKRQAKLVSILFEAKARQSDLADSATISFGSESQVLLNDGKGTKADLSFVSGNFEIINKPGNLPIISSRSHPNQNQWYKEKSFHLHWDMIDGAEYSYILSRDPVSEPDDIPDKPEGDLIWMGDIEYLGLEDGIYYFSLKQKLPKENWSGVLRFRAMIDSTAPEDFQPEIAKDPSLFNNKYFLSFATEDKSSGIAYYEVLEEDKKGNYFGTKVKADWKRAESPYVLRDQNLKSKISVKAVDNAGNEKMRMIYPAKKPISYGLVLGILLGGVIMGWIIYKASEKLKKDKKPKNRN